MADARAFGGLMSGTSLDGVDCVIADLSGDRVRILSSSSQPFDAALRSELLELCEPGPNEVERAARAGVRLADCYAQAVAAALRLAGLRADQVAAIGCHGQTIRHRPAEEYTVQIGNPARLAERTGIAVVADFRSRDVAAGGQGAPLVPAFHRAVFGSETESRAALNIGGIANVTLLPPGGPVRGFDTGPGNCLMDAWIERHQGRPFDRDGEWAASGKVDADLFARLLDDPYFRQHPPKSTGREHFNLRWLAGRLGGAEAPQDVQATLLECTARSIADALAADGAPAQRVIVCGGGTRNTALMRRLSGLLAPRPIELSDRYGPAAQLVEATAFAWLAMRALDGRPGNVPEATGARGLRVLGAIYPA
jgi:anhydro-N-acetylmuramic acid kinase